MPRLYSIPLFVFMLSIEQCRKVDARLKDLPDEEVLVIIGNLYEMAELALEKWKRDGSKNLERSFPESARNVQ